MANTVVSGQTTTATSPANVEGRQRGIELYRQQKFAEAAKLLQKFLKKNRADDEAWHYLGLSLLHNPKQIKEASKAFETALKLRPNFAAARIGLGYSLLLRNKLADAIREAQAGLSLESKSADAHFVIGVVRLRTGARDEALAQAETIIKLDPQYAPGYLLKSQALATFFGEALYSRGNESGEERKDRFKQAADALEKYLQLEPNSGDKQALTEQLESLRFYLASRETRRGHDGPFGGRDVTTKARVISKPEPSYTESARKAQVTGTVVLRAVFASDGTVKHFLVVSGLPYGLTEEAVKAARKIKFTPATIDGRPVSMFIQLEYNFNLY
jgi:TonB family protein